MKGTEVNSIQLRALQTPLKEKYRNEPGSAMITLKAHGDLGAGVSCSIGTGTAIRQAGLHSATGGDGTMVCSGDMLLEALAACAGVTLRAVATAMEISLSGGSVTVEGDLDFRGTLGVSKEVPVGFQQIRVLFELQTEATPEQVEKLIQVTQRYCVVYQSLVRSPEIDVRSKISTPG